MVRDDGVEFCMLHDQDANDEDILAVFMYWKFQLLHKGRSRRRLNCRLGVCWSAES